MNKNLVKRGTCHVFGDDIPLDEGVMAFKFAIGRVNDPAQLIPHLFEGLDPTFARRVKPGDIVIAGRQFGCGKPHIQGFIAMAALEMGVVCESMPYVALRGAITKGLPVLTGCAGARDFAASGDEVEIDFASGEAKNLTRKTAQHFPAMAPVLQDIVAHGGAKGQLAAWLDKHPELKGEPRPVPAGDPLVFVKNR
jgi:3-isopropylmalate/(R)-2-methylmalate dehydratase small subunit